VYDRVSHIETAHDVWLNICNTFKRSSEIKSSHKDIYNRQYQIFSQKPGECLDDCFARFESIVSNLISCGPLAYNDNEHAKQLLYALDDHVWGMKITALEESADFATLDTKKLFSKLKYVELSPKIVLIMMLPLLVKLQLLVLMLVAMMLTPPTPSHFLWSLSCLLLLQLPMNNMRAFSTMRLPCLQGNFGRCTSFGRRGEGTPKTPGAASSAATITTSSSTAPKGRSSTTPTRTIQEEESLQRQEEEQHQEDNVPSMCSLEQLQLLK
jgi:hypothetical protein